MSSLIEGYRVSPQQKRLWQLQREGLPRRSQHTLLLEGEVSPAVMEDALRVTVGRHESLRTSFQRTPDVSTPIQVIEDSAEIVWRTLDWAALSVRERAAGLARLFDETLPRLYGYFLARVGGDRALAEDLTQETYLAAARALSSGGVQIGEPIGWLFGIARHKLIDHYRSREHIKTNRSDWNETVDEISGTDTDLDRIIARDELMTALATLPAGQRLALVLHYADDLSVTETAAALGRSEHAVESLLARGRLALRTYLTALETKS